MTEVYKQLPICVWRRVAGRGLPSRSLPPSPALAPALLGLLEACHEDDPTIISAQWRSGLLVAERPIRAVLFAATQTRRVSEFGGCCRRKRLC
jgi:hypothetical protein